MTLVSSREPKAAETADLLGARLGIARVLMDGLRRMTAPVC